MRSCGQAVAERVGEIEVIDSGLLCAYGLGRGREAQFNAQDSLRRYYEFA